MDKKSRGKSACERTKKNQTLGTDGDPVLEQSRLDTSLNKSKKLKKKDDPNETTIKPSLTKRIILKTPATIEPGMKYKPPKSKKQKRLDAERRKKLEDELNFCKFKVVKIPSPSNIKKLEITLEQPSAEISEAKQMPRKPSATPSMIYPDPPKKKDLSLHQPKSGIILNVSKQQKKKTKKSPKKRKKSVEDDSGLGDSEYTKTQQTIEDIMASELATIEEMLEGGEDRSAEVVPETYLTKQFRKKVSLLSKTTSVRSDDYKLQYGEDEEGEEVEIMDEDEKYISTLVQKFRRDSEEKRYERPKRKIKKGTLESHSFTKLKQPTLKTFYFGIKQGTIHQGDDHFSPETKNKQGICIPAAAFCFSILKHPDRWTQADVDQVLEAGSELYVDSIGSHHIHEGERELTVQDLKKYCKLGNKKVRFVVSEPEVSGLIRSEEKTVYNLTKALNVFFTRCDAGILETEGLYVSIWKDKHFYFFDGSPRTVDLFSNVYGAAILANFYDVASIITVLLNRSGLANSPFIIYSIKAYKVLERNAEEVDSTGAIPELDNYKILSEDKAVAVGSFDLADKCFGFSRNKQALNISIVALVYSKITPASAWHKTTIDKIMIIGNQLFLECISCDEIEEVTIEELPAVFTIGPYLVEIYIYASRIVNLLYKKGNCMLLDAFGKFFEKNRNAILQMDKIALAIWKQRNMYFCFDPYSRNSEGTKCRDGAACVSMHSNLNSLVDVIAANFDDKSLIFNLHAMKVCKIHRDASLGGIFPRNLTLNDYPIEDFKKVKMKRGPRGATQKPVTIDYTNRATLYGANPDQSILEVDSNVKSLAMEDLPQMVHKYPSRSVLKAKIEQHEIIADLDSASLSDTQIEPPREVDEETEEKEISLVDLSHDLTKEEEDLMHGGEGAEDGVKPEGEDAEEQEDVEEEKEDSVKETESDVEAEMLEQAEAGEDWYMAASDFTQVGSHSLAPDTLSAEMNTDDIDLEWPPEELPPTTRKIRVDRQQEPTYDFDMTEEPEVTLEDELNRPTNFVNCPDNSQIVLGSKNMTQFGKEIELMAPFVCIMAVAVAKKYSIDSWSRDIVDYVLKCGSELHVSSKTRYDQVYKLEIPKISLGKTNLSVQVDYVFDNYVKPKVVETALEKILFAKVGSGIIVTPTYACAVFYKNHLYYLFDGFGNNEVGLGKGPDNSGVACFARFHNLQMLVKRILQNKSKREVGENVEYNRFVLSSCHVKLLPKDEEADDDDEDELEDEEEEGEEIDGGEDGEGDKKVKPKKKANEVQVITYKKGKGDDGQKQDKNAKVGYQKVNRAYKIEGSRALSEAGAASNYLKEDYFACVCAALLLLSKPLKRWESKRVDAALEQGEHVFSHADDLDVCSKKFIQNILVDDYFFNIIAKKVEFSTFKSNRTLKVGIETMIGKKHENFILQFPNRCYVVSVGSNGVYHLFDPNDKSGKASWTRFSSFRKLVNRLKSGIVRGAETYNFHTMEISAITKAPREVLIANRMKRFKVHKEKRPEPVGKPFHEEMCWLDIQPIPWSWITDKRRTLEKENGNYWFVDSPNDMYSLFASLSPVSDMFPEDRRYKQTLGILIVAIGMTQIYQLSDWTPDILNSVVLNGDNYFVECSETIEEEDYEMTIDDLKTTCTIFPYSFGVKFTPVVEGTLFLVRNNQFNLYKSLRFFFDKYERRFGIVYVSKNEEDKRHFAFGKTGEAEYFFFDCMTLGPPMYIQPFIGVPYCIRTTTLNRLLFVMTLTMRGGDFFIYDVGMSELKPMT